MSDEKTGPHVIDCGTFDPPAAEPTLKPQRIGENTNMAFTNNQLDAAIDRWRKIPSREQLYRELTEDPAFKAALEAAYARDPSFMTVDAGGWRPNQFNVAIPPARPNEDDPFGPGARDKDAKLKPIPGAAFPS